MKDFQMDIEASFSEGKYQDIVEAKARLTKPEHMLLLGMSYYRLGRLKDALGVFQDISGKIERLSKAYFYMARIYMELEDMDSARSYLERYLSLNPDDDEARDMMEQGPSEEMVIEPSVELARLYAGQGHLEKALEIYKVLIKEGPTEEIRDEALKTQNMYIIRVLEGWLEALKT